VTMPVSVLDRDGRFISGLQEGDFKIFSGALGFVTAAVVGVILNLSLTFGSAVMLQDSHFNIFALVCAVAAFTALYFFKIDVVLVVITGGVIGLVKYLIVS
ncbi:MAG: chromate transporter, partial [Pyrinomonadaceae bacterium]